MSRDDVVARIDTRSVKIMGERWLRTSKMDQPWYADQAIIVDIFYIMTGLAGGVLFLRWPHVAEVFYRGFGFRNRGRVPKIIGYVCAAQVPIAVLMLIWHVGKRMGSLTY
jgi:hypothetical protein